MGTMKKTYCTLEIFTGTQGLHALDRLPGQIRTIQEVAMTRNEVVVGRMHNEEMVIRSLKEKAYYRSVIPPYRCNYPVFENCLRRRK